MLRACLKCIIEQTFEKRRFEVIVCDDGSTDDLSPIVQEARDASLNIIHAKQPPKGPAAARNLGIEAASAPIVVFIDSDVEVDSRLLESLVGTLHEAPQCVGAEARLVPSLGEPTPLWHSPSSVHGGAYHTAAIAYRRDALLEVGGLDEAFTAALCEDAELAGHMLRIGEIRFVPSAVAYHPRRRVTVRYRWFVSHVWRYAVIVGLRHGSVGLPFKATRHPRLRLAYSAVVLIPVGKFLQGIKWMPQAPGVGLRTCYLAICDALFGILALGDIAFTRAPIRRKYVSGSSKAISASLRK